MTIAEIMKKMITFSNGNIHDIDHFLHVWSYAKMIGELEQIDPETQYILEVAAITHDCLLYTSPSPRDRTRSRMPSSA